MNVGSNEQKVALSNLSYIGNRSQCTSGVWESMRGVWGLKSGRWGGVSPASLWGEDGAREGRGSYVGKREQDVFLELREVVNTAGGAGE